MKRLSGVALLLLAACMAETPDPQDPQGRSAARLGTERSSCEALGGTFTEAGLGGLTCVRPTADAGQSCSSDSECEDLCLAQENVASEEVNGVAATFAETGLCASQTPTFGCHSIFRDDGEVVELCID